MTSAAKPSPQIVIYDPDAVAELLAVKSKEEHRALARMVAARLIAYRSDNVLSQRQLAEHLEVSQPRVVELESGEKNPQIETLVKITAKTGLEFAIDIAPIGKEPKLVGRVVTDTPAHIYAGASVLVAAS